MTVAAPVTRDALLARVPGFVAEIADGAARREQERELPFAAFARLRELGLGTIRVPASLGGPGGSASDAIGLIADIAVGDPNVAHALRPHFNYVEAAVLTPEAHRDAAAIPRILSGKLFGGAHTEQGTARPGQVTLRLSRQGGGFRLNGRKWYATGTAFADYASFSAVDDDGQPTGVLIPTDRAGLSILDDWDGMGQRLTASGGVLFENVEVLPEEIVRRRLETPVGRHCSTLRQLHLAACAAGVLRNVLGDGLDYVRREARAAAHSTAETAGGDPFVQQTIGEIAAVSFAVDAAVAAAARRLDDSAAAFAGGDAAAIEAALIESSLATARVQLLLGQLGTRTTERLFDLGGGSTTARALNFDRHWRNVRTVLSHNPLAHKARVVGDYLINGTTTHLREGKVF
nr:acyl-CoA dehydrogenase family protein [uncultured Rhodopila sp.]